MVIINLNQKNLLNITIITKIVREIWIIWDLGANYPAFHLITHYCVELKLFSYPP